MKLYSCAIALIFAAGLSGTAHSQVPDGAKPPQEDLRTLGQTMGQALRVLENNSINQLSNTEIFHAAIRGMVHEVDPENGRFLTLEDYADLAGTSEFVSIGLVLMERDGEVVVVVPERDGPAEKAGIRPKDVVRSIDGTLVKSPDQAVKLLRGKPGSKVEVVVSRSGRPLTFTAERSVVKNSVVTLTTVAPRIAVLSVPGFNNGTLTSVATALAEQWRHEPFDNLVLDLRRNSGGFFESAVGLASLFLPARSVVAEMKGRQPSTNRVYLADPEFYSKDGDPFADVPKAIRRVPLVILVDEGTASGAEIVVAALKHYKRAKVVGRQTFGRSSLQMIFALPDNTAIKITGGYWLTPAHANIDRVGIAPDQLIQSQDPAVELAQAVEAVRKAQRTDGVRVAGCGSPNCPKAKDLIH